MAASSYSKKTLEPGARFQKVGPVSSVWIVKRLVSLPTQPPHVDIQLERDRHERRVLAATVLTDSGRYRRISS